MSVYEEMKKFARSSPSEGVRVTLTMLIRNQQQLDERLQKVEKLMATDLREAEEDAKLLAALETEGEQLELLDEDENLGDELLEEDEDEQSS